MVEEDVIATLNDLLRTTLDGEKRFRALSVKVRSPGLKATFRSAAERCSEGASELKAHICQLGGETSESGAIGGSMQRASTSVKSAATDADEHALLEEAERGEDAAKNVYQAALEKDLPADIRATVQRHYKGVVESCNRVRRRRDAA